MDDIYVNRDDSNVQNNPLILFILSLCDKTNFHKTIMDWEGYHSWLRCGYITINFIKQAKNIKCPFVIPTKPIACTKDTQNV